MQMHFRSQQSGCARVPDRRSGLNSMEDDYLRAPKARAHGVSRREQGQVKVKAARGFTLIEMMVTIAILVVLIAAVGPSFAEVLRSNRLATQSNSLFTALVLTRSEAVKRNHAAGLCKSSDGATCVTSGNWEQGWLIFPDKDNDGTKDSDEAVIRAYGALSGGLTLRAGSLYANRVIFRSDGTVSAQDSFRLCGPDAVAAKARRITINATGRPYTQIGTASCP